MSQLLKENAPGGGLPYRLLKLVRAPKQRQTLHRRIERRFQRMLERGFEAEVRALWSRGDLTPEMPSMRCVGYRQMLKYLSGEYTYSEMVQRGIIATRQFAKRQLTWLRAEPECHWLAEETTPVPSALRIVKTKL
jgi:tRNA dimethylallyltransferase